MQRLVSWLLCSTLALTPIPLAAQQGAASDTAEEGPAAETTPVPVPPEHRSPRATMMTFLGAFADGDVDAAAACLDLSAVPEEVRTLRGRELATELKFVIDRIRLVDPSEIPDRQDSTRPYAFAPDIVIAPDQRGEWLFTSETVAAIPELVARYEDQEAVEGVVEVARTPAMWIRSKVPPQLREVGFLLEVWQWLGLALLIFVGVAVDRMVSAILTLVVERRLRQRLVVIDAELLHTSLRPLGLLAAAALWWVGLTWLGLPDRPLFVLHLAVRFVATVAIVLWVYRMVDVFAAILTDRASRTESKYDDLLVPLLRKSAKVFVAAFGLLFIADSLDLPITSIVAGVGLGGVAFALAGQDVVKNLFGSITVLLDRPFQVGDWVVIQNLEGTVEEVGFRSTRIRTFYNSLITLPNANLLNAAVDNYGARQYRRWKSKLSLTYETPPEKIDAFCEGVRELVRRHPYTRKDYFHVYLNEFGGASLDVLLYVFFEAPDWGTELRERQRLAIDILRLARRLGVEFAYPTQTIHLRQDDGDGEEPQPVTQYASRLSEELSSGRSEARELVDAVLGGKRPPPVGAQSPDGAPGEAE